MGRLLVARQQRGARVEPGGGDAAGVQIGRAETRREQLAEGHDPGLQRGAGVSQQRGAERQPRQLLEVRPQHVAGRQSQRPAQPQVPLADLVQCLLVASRHGEGEHLLQPVGDAGQGRADDERPPAFRQAAFHPPGDDGPALRRGNAGAAELEHHPAEVPVHGASYGNTRRGRFLRGRRMGRPFLGAASRMGDETLPPGDLARGTHAFSGKV